MRHHVVIVSHSHLLLCSECKIITIEESLGVHVDKKTSYIAPFPCDSMAFLLFL